jgi:tetratricopeptide (TPR) repeat protein
MRRLGIATPVDRLLSQTGFLSAGSSKAYTLAGSFIRYLHERYGQYAISELYKTGSFQAAFRTSLAELITGWEQFLDDPESVQLTRDDIALAQWRFDVPSRFHRVCALEIAEWENDARQAIRIGDLATAVSLLEKVVSHDKSVDKKLQLLQLLIRSRELTRGLAIAQSLASDESLGAVVRARALQSIADIKWLSHEYETAHASYIALAELPLNLATQRRLIVSAYATSTNRNREIRSGIEAYLHWESDPTDTEGEAATAHIRALATAHPKDSVIAYLLGRREASLGNDTRAAESYKLALQIGLPAIALSRETHLQLAHSYRRLGELQKARAEYEVAKGLFLSRGYRATIDDWLARCSWLETRPSTKPAEPPTSN